ncbi:MAG: hypothetical protein LBF65_02030 [Holosporales bacterium]|jgi:hypothetical protein|nr:hypothetical protein [Holosporales bacterium]
MRILSGIILSLLLGEQCVASEVDEEKERSDQRFRQVVGGLAGAGGMVALMSMGIPHASLYQQPAVYLGAVAGTILDVFTASGDKIDRNVAAFRGAVQGAGLGTMAAITGRVLCEDTGVPMWKSPKKLAILGFGLLTGASLGVTIVDSVERKKREYCF